MKKIIIGVLAGLLAMNVFAQTELAEKSSSEKVDPYVVDLAISQGFRTKVGQEKVYELSQGLSVEQRNYLYDENKKNGILPFALNFLVGWGIGSYVQGDIKGGNTQLMLNVSGLGLYGAGLALICSGNQSLGYTGLGLWGGAALLDVTSAIIGYIRPWTFAHSYNRNLRHCLRVDETATSALLPEFSPIIDPINNNYGFVAKINF